jgi:Uma2 family endonuclease
MGTTTQLMTFAEFEKLPEEVCRRNELRHGELVEVPPPKHKHRRIQDRLADLLKRYAGDGYVGIEVSFRALPEHEYRTADVAFVNRQRWDSIADDDNLRGVPELVIEILSPSNTAREMYDKRKLCLDNGCREFWLVDPGAFQVDVSTPNGLTATYRRGQSIPLPQFGNASISVDEIFQGLD